MLLGAHESVAGGLDKAFARGAAYGIEAVQIFTKNASQWKEPVLGSEQLAAFRAAHRTWGGGPVIAHDSYLVNLCSDRPDVLARSRASLVCELERCHALGVGVIAFHPGASMGLDKARAIARVGESLDAMLELGVGMTTRLAIENTAGQGTALAWSIDEIAAIIAASGPLADRLGVCLDTQHLFAAGYDLRTAQGYDAFFDEFERKVGISRICSFHLNDSKKGLGERVDRHEAIGRGQIGLYPFWRLVNDPRFASTAGVVELPPDAAVTSFAQLVGLRGAPMPAAPG
jgi:deoxyribonuclease-4